MNESVYLALGSNIDNRLWYMVQALRQLDQSPNINVLQISSIYETEPYGIKGQRDFLNAVIEVETSFRPAKLLTCVKFIERKLGRRSREVWGPREIDIDILAYDQVSLSLSWLAIPHLDLHKRRFVLQPFCEIAPLFRCPGLNGPVARVLQDCRDQSLVRLFIPANEITFRVGSSQERVSL